MLKKFTEEQFQNILYKNITQSVIDKLREEYINMTDPALANPEMFDKEEQD